MIGTTARVSLLRAVQKAGDVRRSYLIAVGVVLLAALWIASGQFSSSAPDGAQNKQGAVGGPSEPITQARVAHLVAASITSKVIVQGETRPSKIIEPKTRVRGQIIEVVKLRGASVALGDPLFRIADNGRTP